MPTDSLASQSCRTYDADIENTLQSLDTYIFSLVKKQLGHNMFFHRATGFDIDDVVQRIRIKLWLALRRRHVYNVRAYVSCIIHTEYIDMLRRGKHAPLFFEIDEAESHQETQNPLEEIESKEIAVTYMISILDDILGCPVPGIIDKQTEKGTDANGQPTEKLHSRIQIKSCAGKHAA